MFFAVISNIADGIFMDGMQLTQRPHYVSGLCRCCKRSTKGIMFKGSASRLGPGQYVRRTEHTCPARVSDALKKRVNIAAKAALKATPAATARQIVENVLLQELQADPDISLPRPDAVIRNCQRAAAIERPKHPKRHDDGFTVDTKHTKH